MFIISFRKIKQNKTFNKLGNTELRNLSYNIQNISGFTTLLTTSCLLAFKIE